MSDEDNVGQSQTASPARATIWRRLLCLTLRLIIPACILTAAGGFLKYQMDTRPQAQRMKPPREARPVAVETVHVQDCRTRIEAMGPVMPAREITVNPEVSGIITEIAPTVVPGGLVEAGQELYTIDSRDYEALVRQRESELAKAELNLKLEAGNQAVARAEYRLLDEVVGAEDEDLVLRKPHMANAQAAVDAARAALDKAQLDVERCTIRAPFNAIIMEKHVDVGAHVSPTTPLLKIIGTDEYWITAKVFPDELCWLEIPQAHGQEGSLVCILNPTVWGPEARREGRVLRLGGEVEEGGRLAQVLVSVEDPLSIHTPGQPVLLSGSFVHMQIEGRMVSDVIVLPRAYLRDGDKVWAMNDANALEIRPVTIVFRGKDAVYIKEGLKDGERIVTTDLAAVVDGMPLRVLDQLAPAPEAKASDAGGTQQP